MTTRSRHDSRGPGRGGRHRSRPHVRTGPPRLTDPAVRRRADALLTPSGPLPLPGVPSPRPPSEALRGARLVRRTTPAPHVSPDAGAGDLASPLPRPVAIAVARAAVARSRSLVPPSVAPAAAWQRGRHRAASARPSAPPVAEPGGPDAQPGGSDAEPGRPAPEAAGPGAGPDALRVESDVPAPDTPRKGGPLPLRRRLRAALLERLPLWVQLRCAVEPKTLAALALVLLVAVGFAVHHFVTGRPRTVAAPRAASVAEPLSPPSASPDAAPAGDPVVVDVAGDVREPGVHRLPRGSRVADALKAAGGVRPGTDTKDLDGLNQARRLVDGEQILVGEAARDGGGPAPAPAPGAPPGPGPAPSPVSLSSATAEQLETLPGVGPVLAGHIIDYRTQHGGFTSVDQLREVDGIGPARFADLRSRVGP